MFKSRLQEFCQSKSWTIPSYTITRDGPDHLPRFKAVVEVNGQSFPSPDCCKSAKEARNLAAKAAIEQLSGVPTSNINTLVTPAVLNVNHPDVRNSSQTISSSCYSNSTMGNKRPRSEHANADGSHIYKNQLQIYTQKQNLDLPEYSTVREGPPHAPRFKSSVTVGGLRYEGLEFFHTLKEAESAAAQIALTSLFPGGITEVDPCMYKILLQELALKEFSCSPNYASQSMGLSHAPVFISNVEIKGQTFQGQESKTKKQAEMSAAKVAYTALKKREHKQGYDHVMKSAVEDGHKFSCSANSSGDGTEVSSHHILSDVRSGLNERFERGKDGQEATPASGQTKEPGCLSTVVTSSGLSVNLEPLFTEDGSEQCKIVVIPNGPDVQIPPGVTVLEKDEKHIAFTMIKQAH